MPTFMLFYILVFLYGIIFGSFCNVCIYRIPEGQSIVNVPSHCMKCGRRLRWYELIPVFSWIALRGRCRTCKAPISAQYPIIEAGNGLLWCLVFAVNGWNWTSVLFCAMTSALLVLSVIDGRTHEIPPGINIFLLVIGLIRLGLDYTDWPLYVIGLISVSAFLAAIFYASKGKAIGGGDVKMMAACGLILGWKCIILAFVIGCILGSVIHLCRMKISGAEHVLAMGPYLAAGVFISALWGNQMITWYLSTMGI